MEPTKFDELTKALATATSRRQALKAIGAAVGGALGLGSIGTAFAAKTCKQLGQGCNTKKNLCCPGLICQNGTCVTCKNGGVACSSNSDCCTGACCDTGSGMFCCDRAAPNICCSPGSNAACCPAVNPVCCPNGSNATCCPAGFTCCSISSGFVNCCAPGGDCATGVGC